MVVGAGYIFRGWLSHLHSQKSHAGKFCTCKKEEIWVHYVLRTQEKKTISTHLTWNSQTALLPYKNFIYLVARHIGQWGNPLQLPSWTSSSLWESKALGLYPYPSSMRPEIWKKEVWPWWVKKKTNTETKKAHRPKSTALLIIISCSSISLFNPQTINKNRRQRTEIRYAKFLSKFSSINRHLLN